MSSKVALITGGASGLGKAIARFLASKQINVIINYNTSKNSAIALKEELEKSYQVKVLLVKCDISKEDEVNNMIEEIKSIEKIKYLYEFFLKKNYKEKVVKDIFFDNAYNFFKNKIEF